MLFQPSHMSAPHPVRLNPACSKFSSRCIHGDTATRLADFLNDKTKAAWLCSKLGTSSEVTTLKSWVVSGTQERTPPGYATTAAKKVDDLFEKIRKASKDKKASYIPSLQKELRAYATLTEISDTTTALVLVKSAATVAMNLGVDFPIESTFWLASSEGKEEADAIKKVKERLGLGSAGEAAGWVTNWVKRNRVEEPFRLQMALDLAWTAFVQKATAFAWSKLSVVVVSTILDAIVPGLGSGVGALANGVINLVESENEEEFRLRSVELTEAIRTSFVERQAKLDREKQAEIERQIKKEEAITKAMVEVAAKQAPGWLQFIGNHPVLLGCLGIVGLSASAMIIYNFKSK